MFRVYSSLWAALCIGPLQREPWANENDPGCWEGSMHRAAVGLCPSGGMGVKVLAHSLHPAQRQRG